MSKEDLMYEEKSLLKECEIPYMSYYLPNKEYVELNNEDRCNFVFISGSQGKKVKVQTLTMEKGSNQ